MLKMDKFTFIDLDTNQIKKEIKNGYEEIMKTKISAGDPAEDFIDWIVYLVCTSKDYMNFIGKMNLLQYSKGKYLDALGALIDVSRITEKEAEIANIQAERAFLEKVDIGIKDIDTVTTNLLSLIAKNVTNDLFLTDIDVKLNEITLTGKSKSKLSIAQFEYNIRSSELFDNIYVDSIKLEDETKAYDFVIKFKAKKEAYQGSDKPANAAKTTGNSKQPANKGTKGGK